MPPLEKTPIDDDGVEIPPPSHNEVRVALQRLKNNKAAGTDGLPAELFKAGGDDLVRSMHKLICKIWLQESLPSDWNLSALCPVLKKADPTICANYRSISLLPFAGYGGITFLRYCEATTTLMPPLEKTANGRFQLRSVILQGRKR